MSFEYYSLRFIIIAAITLFYLIIGSISDLKTREVLNYSNFSLIAIGFAFNTILSVSNSDYIYIAESLLGFAVAYGIAYMMYYTGQWGGGDAKLLMGLGALLGFQYDFSSVPFLIEFFINTLLLGAVYGMLWSFTLAVIHIRKISRRLKSRLARLKKERYFVLGTSAVLFLMAVAVQDYLMKILLLVIGIFAITMFYAWVFTKVVEKTIMYKRFEPEQLTEGEWIVDDVIIDKRKFASAGKVTRSLLERIEKHKEEYGKEIRVEKRFLWFSYTKKAKITHLEPGFRMNQKIVSEDELIRRKERIRRNTLLDVKIRRQGKKQTVNPCRLEEGDELLEDIMVGFHVTGPSDLGIENYQIDILKDLKRQGKVDRILIKEGIPFVPSFLFGFVATVIAPGLLFSLL